jgi:hypothetical protein
MTVTERFHICRANGLTCKQSLIGALRTFPMDREVFYHLLNFHFVRFGLHIYTN